MRALDLDGMKKYLAQHHQGDEQQVDIAVWELRALIAAAEERDRLRDRLREYEQEMIERGTETAIHLISDLTKRHRILAEIEKMADLQVVRWHSPARVKEALAEARRRVEERGCGIDEHSEGAVEPSAARHYNIPEPRPDKVQKGY